MLKADSFLIPVHYLQHPPAGARRRRCQISSKAAWVTGLWLAIVRKVLS